MKRHESHDASFCRRYGGAQKLEDLAWNQVDPNYLKYEDRFGRTRVPARQTAHTYVRSDTHNLTRSMCVLMINVVRLTHDSSI